ncbi:uncharacterized protein LOC106167038 [Lingula anatina]|uniref:Uncharacterized protein LOC106167038 n=1 Tax=Lingula anatina TaxID=7574 RepID=A0A1S3ISW0_LINAN|nr:uncharacterized protein LOC106167038 [Lingula anatina]|eukprot:XP_013401163.1 uncharacterized protein LOC106167038 [Lingula anatina]
MLRSLTRLGAATRVVRIQCPSFSTSAVSNANVGVIGAGQVGRAVALGLLRGGHSVSVTDPSTLNAKELTEQGAKWVDTASEVVAGKEVVITALPAPPHIRQVMEEEGVLFKIKEGACWIDHTTTDADETKRLAVIAQNRGLKMLEAPLTGGLELLKAGLMTVFVGGDTEDMKKYEPLIRSYTDTVLYMGPIGSASVVKVISNMLCAVHMVVAGESAMIAKRHGINLQAFFDGIRASAGNSFVFETEAPLMFNGSFDPGFKIALHCKDLDLGRKLAFDAKVPIEVLGLVEQIYRRAMHKYGEDAGSSHPPKLLEDDLKEPLRQEGYDNWYYTIEKVQGGGIAVVHKFDKK